MATKFLNLSTDTTLGGVSPSDELAVSQKAIKAYVDNHGGGGGLPDQTGHAGEFLTTDGTDASWSDAIGYHPDLFAVKWADHICNDVQWLRADTFSWQSGAVYQAAYNHLADDITGKSLSSETISGLTVQFYLADDGHKICPASEESNVAAIYAATGVAWYYILDTVNQRFKLPRTKFGFTGLRDTVGNYVAPALPNHTHDVAYRDAATTGGQLNGVGAGNVYFGDKTVTSTGASDSTYQNGATVQPPATQMYLYFYVGNFTQTALENTAGLNAELFNNKADITAVAGLAAPDYQNITQLSNIGSYQQIQGDGYILVQGAGGSSWNAIGILISLDGSTNLLQITQANMYGIAYFVPVSKGVYVKRYDSHTTNLTFIPCKGNN